LRYILARMPMRIISINTPIPVNMIISVVIAIPVLSTGS
jgi:hypothetical protein